MASRGDRGLLFFGSAGGLAARGGHGLRPLSAPPAKRALVSAAFTLALAFAPFQCAREPDPNRRIEDEPSEVVYRLAERFKAEGKPDARASTLKFLVERYPTSRYAKQATMDLEEMGQSPPPAASK